MSLKPGDIVTDEPTTPGIVVQDMTRPDGIATLRDWDSPDFSSTGRWEKSYCVAAGECSGHSWGEVVGRAGETRVRRIPEPVPASTGDAAAAELEALAGYVSGYVSDVRSGSFSHSETSELLDALEQEAVSAKTRAAELRAAAPASAEKWEPVTADQVHVGDHIEVHERSGDGERITWGTSERALSVHGDLQLSGIHVSTIGVGITIRRRVRQPMPEPDGPAAVKHARRVLVRGEHDHSGLNWSVFRGLPVDCRDRNLLNAIRISWPEVLALDPATDPVVVDLGGGEA